MPTIAAEALVERLEDWGVDTVFGLPGDGINGIMEGLRAAQDRVRFVLVHHEEAAAFMATGYAKATGRLGVCLATSGPAAIHLLNGLYDAKLDHVPVLAITGMQETSVLGTGYQQEVHLDQLYDDVAEYNLMVDNPAQLPGVVDIAIRTALARRGVAHLTIPNDVQVADADADPYEHVAPAPAARDRADLPARARAARATRTCRPRPTVLNDGREGRDPGRCRRAARPRGGAGGRRAARRTDHQDAAGQGGRSRTTSPYAVGGIGLLGTRPRRGPGGGLRHAAHGRHQLPLHQAPARARARPGWCRSRPTRPGPGSGCPTEVPMIGDARESLRGAAAAAQAARTTEPPGEVPEGHGGVAARTWRRWRAPDARPDRPAVRDRACSTTWPPTTRS